MSGHELGFSAQQLDCWLDVLLEGHIGARFGEMKCLWGVAGATQFRDCGIARFQTYASAHSFRLNSACCALRCALVTLEETFFSDGGVE